MKYRCICCGHLTLQDDPKLPTFEVCPVCFWENDPKQNADPNFFGGENRVSLNRARKNFLAYGATEERFTQNVRPPHPDE